MSAGRSASFCLRIYLLLCYFLLCLSEALENIKAVVGQEVTLKCKVNNNNNNIPIIVVEWNRPGLKEDYVLYYRHGKLMSDYLHPSYVNRVDLQDREMKDGDVSMILKDVKMNDTGTYECRVYHGETNRRKRLTKDPINIIYLDVGPSGHKDGGDKDGGDKDGGDKDGGGKDGGDKVGGDKAVIGLGVVGFLLTVVMSSVASVISRRCNKKSNLPDPPDEAANLTDVM